MSGLKGSALRNVGYQCPIPFTEEDVKRDEPQYQRNYQNYGKYSQIRVFETPDFLLRYDFGDAVWAMCVKDLFTIDFDIKEGITQDDAVVMIKKYTDFMHSKGVDMLFSIVTTDRGLHAHLVSERLIYGDDRTLQTSLELCNDKNYIIFTGFNGFCMRVAPKLKKQRTDPITGEPVPGKEWMTEDEISKEFVGKACYEIKSPIEGLEPGLRCTIGYGRADPYLEMMLDVYEKLIEFFKSNYMLNLKEFTANRSFEWNGVKYDRVNAPPVSFLQEAKDYAGNLLRSYGVISTGEYQIPMKWRGFMTEYEPFLEKNTLYRCAHVSPFEINRRARTVVLDAWKQNCPLQSISIAGLDDDSTESQPGDSKPKMPVKLVAHPTGKKYPFVFGVDRSSHMIFIQFRDLLMLDWDVKDGFPKAAPAQMLSRYLTLSKTLPKLEKIIQTPMAFRCLETDNGIHSFCVSHFMPYDVDTGAILSPPLEIMHNTCVDAWYIAFVKTRGFSIRMGPKIINRARGLGQSDTMKTAEEIQSQFIQKNGVVVPGRSDRLVYLGEGIVDPYLDALVDFIYDMQQYILQIPDLPRRILEDPDGLSVEMGEVVKATYDRDVRPLENPDNDPKLAQNFENDYEWADRIFRCPNFPL
jgi:hypothetical protein